MDTNLIGNGAWKLFLNFNYSTASLYPLKNLHKMNRLELNTKIGSVSGQLYRDKGYISLVDVFIGLGYLSQKDYEAWRNKKVPYLEKVIGTNLSKISFICKTVINNSRNGKLKESYTAYKSWGKGPKIDLPFSKYGKPEIEKSYSTHFVNPNLGV